MLYSTQGEGQRQMKLRQEESEGSYAEESRASEYISGIEEWSTS